MWLKNQTFSDSSKTAKFSKICFDVESLNKAEILGNRDDSALILIETSKTKHTKMDHCTGCVDALFRRLVDKITARTFLFYCVLMNLEENGASAQVTANRW